MANSAALSSAGHGRMMPWVCWGITVFFTLFQFLLQLSSGVMLHEIMHSFAITALGASILGSAFFYIYVILQVPAGLLIDHFKPRYLLTIGALISAIGCVLFGLSHNFYFAMFARVLMGGGCAFAFVGMLHVIREWFSPKQFSVMTGLAELIGMAGSAIGIIILAKLLGLFHWRDCMFGSGIVLFLTAIACWCWLRDREVDSSTPLPEREKIPFVTRLRLCVHNRLLWLNGLYSGLVFSVMTVFAGFWGIPFFMQKAHLSLTMASAACTAAYIGTAVGSPLCGYLYQRVGKHKVLMTLCSLGTAIFLAALLYIPHLSTPLIFVLMFAMGASCSSYLLSFSLTISYGSPKARTTSLGFTNMLSMLTAPLLQPLVGLIMHIVADEKGRRIHEMYSLHDYHIALSTVVIAVLAAAIVGFNLPEVDQLDHDQPAALAADPA